MGLTIGEFTESVTDTQTYTHKHRQIYILSMHCMALDRQKRPPAMHYKHAADMHLTVFVVAEQVTAVTLCSSA